MRINLVILALTALAIGSTVAASAATKPSYWTESAAEKFVIHSSARVPCTRVRREVKLNCNLKEATAWVHETEERVAHCGGEPVTDITDAIRNDLDCATKESDLDDANWQLGRIRDGFPMQSADCIGGGKSDAGGFRFTQFRCKVVVENRAMYDAPSPGKVTLVGGRIAVYVTGPRSFSWRIIP
jgi:hypothetical protein